MKPKVAIRRCVPGDQTALALVGQASFLETFAGILEGADVIAHCVGQHAPGKYEAWLSDGHSALWLAEVEPGAAPVGFLLLTKPDLPLADLNARDWEIKRIYLLHRFQGAGLGQRLMAVARSHAESVGARRLLLGVYSGNESAISFYERLGYGRLGERPFLVGTRTCRDLILSLPLGDATI